jgi:hypothetical protein
VEHCPNCGGALKIIAAIDDPPYLAKFLENLCLIFWRDPNASATDRNLHRTISLPGVNADPPSLGGKLNGIGKKIEEYLLDLPFVADEIAKTLVNCNIEIDAMLGSTLAHKGAADVVGAELPLARRPLRCLRCPARGPSKLWTLRTGEVFLCLS